MNGIDITYKTKRGERMVKQFHSMRRGGVHELQRLAREDVEAEARNHCGDVVGSVWHDHGRVVWAADLTA